MKWLIEIGSDGNSKIFDMVPGRTTLAEARRILREQGETSLFRSAEGTLALETYFQKVFLSGLRADFILTTEADTQTLQRIYDAGLRVSQLGGGTHKVRLSAEDLSLVDGLPIGSITYLPSATLDGELVTSRFGQPDQKISEEKGVTHWLYPKWGLDVTIDPEGKDVLTYVAPSQFSRILAPLEARPSSD